MKITRSVSIVLAAVLPLAFSSGCATYGTISTAEQGSPKVYSGARLDVSAVLGDEFGLRQFKTDPPMYHLEELPSSMAIDTAILPLRVRASTGEFLSS